MHRKIITTALTLVMCGIAPAFADPTPGAVYAMTNALDDNEIVVYDRAADGTLSLNGYYSTLGRGVGATEEPEDALGSQSPLILSPGHRWLVAVNACSD